MCTPIEVTYSVYGDSFERGPLPGHGRGGLQSFPGARGGTHTSVCQLQTVGAVWGDSCRRGPGASAQRRELAPKRAPQGGAHAMLRRKCCLANRWTATISEGCVRARTYEYGHHTGPPVSQARASTAQSLRNYSSWTIREALVSTARPLRPLCPLVGVARPAAQRTTSGPHRQLL